MSDTFIHDIVNQFPNAIHVEYPSYIVEDVFCNEGNCVKHGPDTKSLSVCREHWEVLRKLPFVMYTARQSAFTPALYNNRSELVDHQLLRIGVKIGDEYIFVGEDSWTCTTYGLPTDQQHLVDAKAVYYILKETQTIDDPVADCFENVRDVYLEHSVIECFRSCFGDMACYSFGEFDDNVATTTISEALADCEEIAADLHMPQTHLYQLMGEWGRSVKDLLDSAIGGEISREFFIRTLLGVMCGASPKERFPFHTEWCLTRHNLWKGKSGIREESGLIGEVPTQKYRINIPEGMILSSGGPMCSDFFKDLLATPPGYFYTQCTYFDVRFPSSGSDGFYVSSDWSRENMVYIGHEGWERILDSYLLLWGYEGIAHVLRQVSYIFFCSSDNKSGAFYADCLTVEIMRTTSDEVVIHYYSDDGVIEGYHHYDMKIYRLIPAELTRVSKS